MKKGTKKNTGPIIEVKNFGPIDNGVIELKPLTVFIGANNSGKSYMAMLIYSIFETYSSLLFLKIDKFTRKFGLLDLEERLQKETKEIKTEIQIFLSELKNLSNGEVITLPEKIINKMMTKIVEIVYSENLYEIITDVFGAKISDITKIKEKELTICIDLGISKITIEGKNKLKIKECSNIPKIKIKIAKRKRVDYKEDKNELIISITKRYADKLEWYSLVDIIAIHLIEYIIKDNFCYYLPAARSGILQSFVEITSGIVKKSGVSPGVVRHFLSSLIDISALRRKGDYAKLAENLEKEITKGKISVSRSEVYKLPDIYYTYQEKKFPIQIVSSSISEVAPLVIYLKYVLTPGSILIIEEPEAHLHPENQRILAKYIVKLVRMGIWVLITTHSDYLLEQINNFIMLSKLKPKKREELGFNDEFLNYDEVSAYLFKFKDCEYGSTIERLSLSQEGIPEDEFIKVQELLYHEILTIRELLEEEDEVER